MKKIFTGGKILFCALTAICFSFISDSARAQCSGMPVSGTIVSISADTLCSGSSGFLKLTGNSSGTGIHFKWQQFLPAGSTWLNGGGNDSAATFTTQPLAGTSYYRCYVTCITSGLSDTSATFTIYTPGLLSVDNDTVCSPGSYYLRAHGVGATTWYASDTTSIVLSNIDSVLVNVSGDSVFYSTSTYFHRYLVGKADTTAGGGSTPTLTNGLVVKSLSDFVLDTVFVYPMSAGTMKITLTDTITNLVVDSITVSFIASQIRVKTPLHLNWNIPAGHTYFMREVLTSGVSTFRDPNSGGVYPYTAPGIMSITRNILNNVGAYYFFYDWRIHNGCTSSRVPVPLHIGPLVITATASSDSICAGGPVTLTASGASSYHWQPNNVSGNPVIAAPSATTTYTVVGAVGAGCSDSTYATVNVGNVSTIVASASNYTVCTGTSVTLSASGALSYQWSPLGTSGSSVVINATATLTYTASGTNAFGCIATDTATVNVIPVTVIATASDDTICLGSPVTLTASGADTYVWNGSIPGNIYTLTPGSTDTYTVVGTNTSNSCTGTTTVTVNLSYVSLVVFVAPNDTICPGAALTLTGGGANSYLWNSGTGTQTGTVAHFNPVTTTTYTVIGTNTVGCSDTSTVLINTNSAVPVASFSYTDTSGHYTFINSSQNGVNYVWHFGDGNTSLNMNPTYTFSSMGSFTVWLIVTNPCGSDSAFQTIIVNGIENMESNAISSLSAWPNPSRESIQLSYSLSAAGETSLMILDELGRNVFEKTSVYETAGKHSLRFDPAELQEGIYFCKLISANSAEVIKIVIVK